MREAESIRGGAKPAAERSGRGSQTAVQRLLVSEAMRLSSPENSM